MSLSAEQESELALRARPVVKWLNDNGHPHMTVIIECDGFTLNEALLGLPMPEEVKG